MAVKDIGGHPRSRPPILLKKSTGKASFSGQGGQWRHAAERNNAAQNLLSGTFIFGYKSCILHYSNPSFY